MIDADEARKPEWAMRIFGFVCAMFLSLSAWADPPALITQLTSTDGTRYSAFGSSVSLSGNEAIVGAYGQKQNVGSAYIFSSGGNGWTQEIELLPDDLIDSVEFGNAVAISGDTAMVGAPATIDGGAVFVYARVNGQWIQTQRLLPNDPAGGTPRACFGCSIALSGNTALIGARSKTVGSVMQQGAVYVFTFDGREWRQSQELTASDGAPGDWFGTVALSGNTALIGAPNKNGADKVALGAVYVFSFVNATWVQQQMLQASDGQSDDFFGAALAVSGSSGAIGSTLHRVGANAQQGQVYLFSSQNGVWTEQQILRAGDGIKNDQFGSSIAMTADTLLVAAIGKVTSQYNLTGVVYAFARTSGAWTQSQEITTYDSRKGSDFGSSLAIHGTTAIIGADGANVGQISPQGATYVFDRVGDGVFFDGFDF